MSRQKHWGEWMLERSRVVGFKRLIDLANAVGCTRERITQWGSSPKPPAQMRKGFDRKLARALRTTPEVLFLDYVNLSPEEGPRVIELLREKSFPPTLPWEDRSFSLAEKGWHEMSIQEKLRVLILYLDDRQCEPLLPMLMKMAEQAHQAALLSMPPPGPLSEYQAKSRKKPRR